MKPHTFSNAIIKWFHLHGRHDLPWQKNQTPYRVWVSEIMLQQTQVTTATPYYIKFMRRFPTVKSLALAGNDDVLAHWSGLGYYARARNLHKTAKIIHKNHAGRFPFSIEGLMELPGIGRSTAGAILSFSRKVYAPILDGNVKRVLTRCFAINGWPGDAKVLKKLWEYAETYTPQINTHHYNQALMDLGATICTRSKPKCNKCPLEKKCIAHLTQTETNYPTSKPKKSYPTKKVHALIIEHMDESFLLVKRPPIGIWGGLWTLPECTIDEDPVVWCNEKLGLSVEYTLTLDKLYHKFSHFQLEIHSILLKITNTNNVLMDAQNQVWYKCGDRFPGGAPAPLEKIIMKYNIAKEEQALWPV